MKKDMDSLKAAATAFERLLPVRYKIILGRKRRLTELEIGFDKTDFFHLAGLQYLKDLPQLKAKRNILFDEVLNGTIAFDTVRSSAFFNAVEQRIIDLSVIESILDRNDLIFKYTKDRSTFSNISAEYFLKTPLGERTNYIFIDSPDGGKLKYCKSFFCNDTNNYSFNQVSMTLLYKEKCNLSTGESIVQLDRLHKA